MARARNIKPGFFKNEVLVGLPFEYRLLFVGLWTLADREGRLEDRPFRIKMEIFPADSVDVEAGLAALQTGGFIQRYEIDGCKYIQVLAWQKHQNPHCKESASTIPAPCEHHASQEKAVASRADSLIPDSLIPDSKKISSSAGADPIPYAAIVQAYHDSLPMLPAVRKLSEPRRKKLRARWLEDEDRQSLDYWREFFAYAAKSDFLTGRDGRWTGCDFEWLIEASNHLKVTEGKYENRSAA